MTATEQGLHGTSAYFSQPERTLDPALFAGNKLRPEARDYMLLHLKSFLEYEKIMTGSWLHAWAAGSGVSYQWKAPRAPGDLDVLLGIDPLGFAQMNPGLAVRSRHDLAALLNEQMRKYLWPLTAEADIGGSTYEVTYYWNPEVSSDIRVIRPYAAWNLGTSQWDVPPDPAPPVTGFPAEWDLAARRDEAWMRSTFAEWSQALADVLLFPPGNRAAITAGIALQRTTAELRRAWTLLHDGRRSAFAGGEGWADYHNYRWQHAKAEGVITLLRQVIAWDDYRRSAEDTRLYGAPVEPAEQALRRAAAAYTRWAGR